MLPLPYPLRTTKRVLSPATPFDLRAVTYTGSHSFWTQLSQKTRTIKLRCLGSFHVLFDFSVLDRVELKTYWWTWHFSDWVCPLRPLLKLHSHWESRTATVALGRVRRMNPKSHFEVSVPLFAQCTFLLTWLILQVLSCLSLIGNPVWASSQNQNQA